MIPARRERQGTRIGKWERAASSPLTVQAQKPGSRLGAAAEQYLCVNLTMQSGSHNSLGLSSAMPPSCSATSGIVAEMSRARSGGMKAPRSAIQRWLSQRREFGCNPRPLASLRPGHVVEIGVWEVRDAIARGINDHLIDAHLHPFGRTHGRHRTGNELRSDLLELPAGGANVGILVFRQERLATYMELLQFRRGNQAQGQPISLPTVTVTKNSRHDHWRIPALALLRPSTQRVETPSPRIASRTSPQG